MQEPYKPPDDAEMICPNCGSSHVSLDETKEITNTHNEKLKQYICSDCKVSFIPMLLAESPDNNIKNWAIKNRTKEGMNEGKAWSKPKQEFVIIVSKNNK